MLPVYNNYRINFSNNKNRQECIVNQKYEKLNKTLFFSACILSSNLKQYGIKNLKEINNGQKILATLYPIIFGLIAPNKINIDESSILLGNTNDKKVKNYLFIKQVVETAFTALIYFCSTPHKYLKEKHDKKSNIIAACLAGIALVTSTISNIATWKNYKKENQNKDS